jgi:hypothetical protein
MKSKLSSQCPFAALARSFRELAAVWDRHVASEADADDHNQAELYFSRFVVAFSKNYSGPISPEGRRFLLKCAAMVANCAEVNEERATLDAIRPALNAIVWVRAAA